MYCLVPIGAIDLNQDSNAALKDINVTTNNTSIDNINDTIEDKSKMDIEKINTDNNTITEDNSDQSKCTPDITIHVRDSKYGEKIYLEITHKLKEIIMIILFKFHAHNFLRYTTSI